MKKILLSFIVFVNAYLAFAENNFIEFSQSWTTAYVYQANKKYDSAGYYYNKAEKLMKAEYGYTFYLDKSGYFKEINKKKEWLNCINKAIELGISRGKLAYRAEIENDELLKQKYQELIIKLPEFKQVRNKNLDYDLGVEISKIMAIDQFFRWDSLYKGINCKERKLNLVDSISISSLEKVFTQYSFPSTASVGDDVYGSFKVLLLHLIMYDNFEKKWGDLILENTKNGNFPNTFYAWMIDRKNKWLQRGDQIYGWYDYDWENKKYGPFNDIAKVDMFRQEIGLPSVYEDYLSGKIAALPSGYEPPTNQVKFYKWLKK